MLNFDIEKAPPTQAEIDKRWWMLAAAYSIFANISVVSLYIGLTQYDEYAQALVLLGLGLLMLIAIKLDFEVPFFYLKPITLDNVEIIIDLCEKYPECDSYKDKVAAIGRELVKAEYKAMMKWPQIIEKRKKKTEIEEKRRLLYSATKRNQGKRN